MEKRMPVLFVGHGSPMNAVKANSYTHDLSEISGDIPEPEAIVVVSAHWQTRGTFITSGENPQQIYDFYGFPERLYSIKYTAPGSLSVAEMFSAATGGAVALDPVRGIDHAAWAVLLHMYPDQTIPVLELSLDVEKSAEEHYAFAKMFSSLRDNGILLLGSGNMVHNLMMMSFIDDDAFDWAIEFDSELKRLIVAGDHDALVNYENISAQSRLAVPTNEHYLPMLYSLALKENGEAVNFFHESIQNGSVSMRGFIIR